mmetsp:Transcript_6358/g.22728  ORF Transcript_6358/g.22728 Transcript_6358/m.22728 type:complete len:260 (-) Transcript_6358:103-882(-)
MARYVSYLVRLQLLLGCFSGLPPLVLPVHGVAPVRAVEPPTDGRQVRAHLLGTPPQRRRALLLPPPPRLEGGLRHPLVRNGKVGHPWGGGAGAIDPIEASPGPWHVERAGDGTHLGPAERGGVDRQREVRIPDGVVAGGLLEHAVGANAQLRHEVVRTNRGFVDDMAATVVQDRGFMGRPSPRDENDGPGRPGVKVRGGLEPALHPLGNPAGGGEATREDDDPVVLSVVGVARVLGFEGVGGGREGLVEGHEYRARVPP